MKPDLERELRAKMAETVRQWAEEHGVSKQELAEIVRSLLLTEQDPQP